MEEIMMRIIRLSFVCLALLASRPSWAQPQTLIDFEQFTNLDNYFSQVQPPLSVGGATFSGGQLVQLGSTNPSAVYGTAFFCNGCSPQIRIDFSLAVSNISFTLINGNLSVGTYTVSNNRGESLTTSPLTQVDLPWSDITSLTIQPVEQPLYWDFSIDNIRFNSGTSATTVPVILVHGWCGSPNSFGKMANLLTQDGFTVQSYDYSIETQTAESVGNGITIEDLAFEFAGYINHYLRDSGASQVDVVAHSMGGVVARAWMAGMTLASYQGQIRKLIEVGTPNYGVSLAAFDKYRNFLRAVGYQSCSSTQSSQLSFGSSFIWKLHDAWLHNSPILPENILFIAGTQDDQGKFYECNLQGCDDGLVQVSSAVLPDTPDERIRYVPYKHSGSIPTGNNLSIAEITDSSHKSYQIIKNFLTNSTVIPQCCGEGSTDYQPPFQRGVKGKNEGLLLLRFQNPKNGMPVDLIGTPTINFEPDPGSFTEQANNPSGTITAWGVKENTYQVTFRSAKSIPLVIGVQIKTARPNVPYAQFLLAR